MKLIQKFKQGMGLLCAALCLIFVGAPGMAAATSRHSGVDIVSPKRHETLSALPVSVTVNLNKHIKKGSFVAKLNGHKISDRFTVNSSTATASLGKDDGIRTYKQGQHRRANTLQVWAKGTGHHHSQRYHDEQTFYVKIASQPNPDQVSGVIGANGGSLELPGIGSVNFPAGAFAADTTVTVSKTQSAQAQELFDQTAASLFDASGRLGYEIHVTTGGVQPLLEPQVSLVVPESFRTAVPVGSEVRIFAESYWEDTEEIEDSLDALPDRFMATDETISASIPVYFFTNSVRTDGQFDLMLVVASTPTAPLATLSTTSTQSAALPTVAATGEDAQTPSASTRAATTLAAGACEGSSLGAPLDGNLRSTSGFGMRQHPVTGAYQGHGGTDYAANNGSTVKSMADGVVERVGNDTRTVNGKTVGWGNYVIVLHSDGSRTLYAHLQSGTAVAQGTHVDSGDRIADSDNSGGSTGPHLHVEYAPNGQIYNKSSKIDPEPCIGGNVTGSITVSDNGNLADDAFSVAIDGLTVCTTTIGASNTCAVGGLRPGTKTLTITAVIAPDNVGTYQISLGDGLTFSGGGTQEGGVIDQGASATYSVIVPNN